jgi:sugar lactone lactonase YvrE
MADPAHGRVISFDPKSATSASEMSSADNVDYLQVAMDMSGGQVVDLIPASYGLKRPSGLELHGDFLYVSDAETSTIHKLTTSGKPVTRVTIPGVKSGGLAGLAFGVDGRLYFVDMQGSRVLRLEAKF